MLEHLHESAPTPEVLNVPLETFLPMKKANAEQILEAQINTSDWLTELGAKTEDEILTEMEHKQVTEAFKDSLSGSREGKNQPDTDEDACCSATLGGDVDGVRLAVCGAGAAAIRGMAVAKILEETDHPDARIRLKALEMLGKVTEVGLFTERIEIKKTELSDVELDERIKQKLEVIQKTIEVDATEVDAVEDEQSH
jgi:hypothetical protein